MKLSELVRTAGLRTASSDNAFWYLVPSRDYTEVAHSINDADEQTAGLFVDVCEKLAGALKLSSGEAEALDRVLQVVKNHRTWKPDLIRNNVFKAANALGLKLPSHMF
jgi:hypothetical protein